ncbi:VOC family protein [Thalassotalea sp. 1_MG-2023]|uniref:VOC family protein n=1 Tax=Thalassotalea sp. 1_MG-2023 TaxID=3062680 RepID=UPI0026E25247|nr:VOC family protein [Thalassotalea sp. 1_MG-2023]MDO6428436.1 VOC family protein [Thalassotalea sp. 1_MG-2023]
MKANTGEMAWLDLSVQNATEVKDFYQNVIGWQTNEVSMGDYQDYAMLTPGSGDAVAGICHAKGCNIDLPAAWLPYFLVADIEQAVTATKEKGGELITDIKSMGQDKYAVIKDPAGAVCAIYQKSSQ